LVAGAGLGLWLLYASPFLSTVLSKGLGWAISLPGEAASLST